MMGRNRNWKKTLPLILAVAFLLPCCGICKDEVKKVPDIDEKRWIMKLPQQNPCWLWDLTEDCLKPKEGVIFYRAISQPSTTKSEAIIAAQDNGATQIANDMEALVERTLVRAGVSERQAGKIVAESAVSNDLRSSVHKAVVGGQWTAKTVIRGFQTWDGQAWGPEVWEFWTLIHVPEQDKDKIAKQAIDKSRNITEETRQRAKELLDKRGRDLGILESPQ